MGSYKRTKSDSKQKCPHCGAQWSMSLGRHYIISRYGYCRINCKKCGRGFVINEKYEASIS